PFEGFSRQFQTTPDLRILAFTCVLSLATGILFTLAPAWQSTRPKLADTLKDQAGATSAPGRQVRLRKGLLVAQVALSLILLVGTGLFARSLYNLRTVDAGMRIDHLLSFSVDPALNGHDRPARRLFYQSLQQKLSAMPGVRSTAVVWSPPL